MGWSRLPLWIHEAGFCAKFNFQVNASALPGFLDFWEPGFGFLIFKGFGIVGYQSFNFAARRGYEARGLIRNWSFDFLKARSPGHEAEAEALAFSKHEAAACQVLASYNKYPFLPLIIYLSFVEIRAKYTGKHDLKMKNVEFFKFWVIKTNCKIFGFVRLRSRTWSRSLFQITKLKSMLWLFGTTKLKLKWKLLPQMLRLCEAASYPCLASAPKKRRLDPAHFWCGCVRVILSLLIICTGHVQCTVGLVCTN